MANQTADFFNDPDSCRTLALEVGNRTFWVPRDTMAVYSPVFKTMLYGPFVESGQDRIRLPDKLASDVEELLHCLIPAPDLKPIDDQNIDLILDFADEYQIELLRDRASLFLMTKLDKCTKGDPAILEILRLASDHRLRRFLESCLKRCANDFVASELRSWFGRLKTEVIACLLFYKTVPSDSQRCKFETSTIICGHNHSHGEVKLQKCKNCTNQYCEYCDDYDARRRASDRVCLPKVKEIEDTVRDLLDRM